MSHLVLIPLLRLSHCPYLRISNVKPAHASDDISIHHGAVPVFYIHKDSTPAEQGTPYYIYKREYGP